MENRTLPASSAADTDAANTLALAFRRAHTENAQQRANRLFAELAEAMRPTLTRHVRRVCGARLRPEITAAAQQELFHCALVYSEKHAARGWPFGGFLHKRLLKSLGKAVRDEQALFG